MKGILKSFEATIAIFVIITAYFVLFGAGEKIPEIEIVLWKLRGMETLKNLDDLNILGTLALENNTVAIKSELSKLLPLGLNYEVVVCTEECPKTSFESEKIVSVNYFIAGNLTNVEPREIVLYMWR